jgi:hypothetical protein
MSTGPKSGWSVWLRRALRMTAHVLVHIALALLLHGLLAHCS